MQLSSMEGGVVQGNQTTLPAVFLLTLAAVLPWLVGAFAWRVTRARPFMAQTNAIVQSRLAATCLAVSAGLAGLAALIRPLGAFTFLLPILVVAAVFIGRNYYLFLVTSEEAARRLQCANPPAFETWRERTRWWASRAPGSTSLIALAGGAAFLVPTIMVWDFVGDPSLRPIVLMLGAASAAFIVFAAYRWFSSVRRADFWVWREMARLSWHWSPGSIDSHLAQYLDRVAAWAGGSRI